MLGLIPERRRYERLREIEKSKRNYLVKREINKNIVKTKN